MLRDFCMNFEYVKVLSQFCFLSVNLARNMFFNIFLRSSQKLAVNSILLTRKLAL
jgi:hypothetical protein